MKKEIYSYVVPPVIRKKELRMIASKRGFRNIGRYITFLIASDMDEHNEPHHLKILRERDFGKRERPIVPVVME